MDKFDAPETDKDLIERFLKLPPSTTPEVKRVAVTLKSKNDRTGFLLAMIKQEGFAIWDKIVVNTTNTNLSGISTRIGTPNDTILYIPLVADNTTHVNAFIYAKLNGSVHIQLHRANDFASYGFGNVQDSTDNAERLALQIMVLDKLVFGHKKFKLLDDRLFADPTTVNNNSTHIDRFLEINDSESSVNKNRNVRLSGRQWQQGSVTHCTQSTSFHCTGSMVCQPNCDNCELCVTTGWNCVTTVQYYFVPGDDNSNSYEGGNGGGGGSGNPTQSTGLVPCNPTPGLDNGLLPCPHGNTTGWMPVLEEIYDPYSADNVITDTSITNNFPCLGSLLDTISNFGNLNQKAQVALSQIFNVNKRIHTTIKLDRTLSGTTASAYTRRTGTTPVGEDLNTLDFSATIYVNPDMLQNATKEYIAATMIHEAMHAYIDYIFTLYNQGYIPPADSNHIKSKFPIFWGKISPNSPPFEIQQHNLIALNWVQQVSDPLYAFTNNNINPVLKDSIYRALGWGGLEDTDIFKQKSDKCNTMAINIAARNKNLNMPFTIVGFPECTAFFSVTAQNLKLKNLCD